MQTQARWAVADLPNGVHVLPVDDVVDHDLTEDCLCGPLSQLFGDREWSVVHHSLDGRERHE
jgi:hypothetical protein